MFLFWHKMVINWKCDAFTFYVQINSLPLEIKHDHPIKGDKIFVFYLNKNTTCSEFYILPWSMQQLWFSPMQFCDTMHVVKLNDTILLLSGHFASWNLIRLKIWNGYFFIKEVSKFQWKCALCSKVKGSGNNSVGWIFQLYSKLMEDTTVVLYKVFKLLRPSTSKVFLCRRWDEKCRRSHLTIQTTIRIQKFIGYAITSWYALPFF